MQRKKQVAIAFRQEAPRNEPRETYDGTIVAQKFLSCVYRIAQNSDFNVGLNHVIEVLTGADTEKITRWGHDRLTTYGIGKELSRPAWAAVGRELMRLGYVGIDEGEYATLHLTASGMAVLRARTPITLTKTQELFLDGNPVQIDKLAEALKKMKETQPGVKLELEADTDTALGVLMKVWDGLRSAGFSVNDVPARIQRAGK